jgi:hypothetical protein
LKEKACQGIEVVLYSACSFPNEADRILLAGLALKEGFNGKSGNSLRRRKAAPERGAESVSAAEGCVFRSFLYA